MTYPMHEHQHGDYSHDRDWRGLGHTHPDLKVPADCDEQCAEGRS